MPTRFTVVCDDDVARDVESLATEYGLTEEEVLRQLVDLGLDEVEETTGA
jgi:predicted transcriptional regulator